jgi:hypothetical protein
VDEHGAAAPSDARSGIVVDLDNQIIEAVVAAEAVAWFIGRPPERPIITPVMRIFAPGIVRPYAANGQRCTRPLHAVGTPPQPHRVKYAVRRAAVTFMLQGPDTGSPERNRQGQGAGNQPTLRPAPRPSADADGGERIPPHVLAAPISKSRLLF